MSRSFTAPRLAFFLATTLLFVSSYARADAVAAAYKAKCAACHGADGSGQTPMGKKMHIADLRAPEVQKRSNPDLMKIIADGKLKMPSYGKKLTAEEIKGLVLFIRGLAPNK